MVVNTPWMDYNKRALPPQTLQEILQFLHTSATHCVKIYTDGSKHQDGRTGSAFYSQDLNIGICKRPPNTYSVFSAEAMAMYSALRYVLTENVNRAVLVCTDSQSLLKTLTNPKSVDSNNFIITDILNTLQELKDNGLTIHLVWVPSHIGLHGNEKADKLALLSSQSDQIALLDTPTPDIIRQISHDQNILWDTHWRLTNGLKGRAYAQLFPSEHLPKKTWFAAFKGQTRSFYSSIGRLRFSHAPSPDRLFAWKLAFSPACACSFSPATLDHQLFHCPRYATPRQNLIACLSLQKIHPPFHLPSILSTQDKKTYFALHDLYKSIFVQKF
jgi:ribonuclease HI